MGSEARKTVLWKTSQPDAEVGEADFVTSAKTVVIKDWRAYEWWGTSEKLCQPNLAENIAEATAGQRPA